MTSETVRLTPLAENDLEEIWRYTARTWSRGQADSYLDTLFDTFDLLADMPGLARERTEFVPPVRIHPKGPHVIVYRLEGGTTLVLRVLGARQDWVRSLEALD